MKNQRQTYDQKAGHVPAWLRERLSLQNHVRGLMAGMPDRWVNAAYTEWEKRRAVDAIDAGRWGHALVRKLRAGEIEGVLIGDDDRAICERAMACARHISDMLAAIKARVIKARPGAAVHHIERMAQRLQAWWARADMAARGLEPLMPAGPGITRRGMLARLADDRWWRRLLRKAHAAMLETAAIDLGFVRAGRGQYVSDESLKRRRGQVARNAAALACTLAVNERAESLTLAEVAARGVADKAVRRAELMTRISGFECIANDVGHQADFVTVTCPSRFHKWRRGDQERTTANPAYDGSTPGQAQKYLAKQWGRFRSAAARAGLDLYGFRIAEPHHDGCPHWHMLLWHKGVTSKGADAGEKLNALLLRYFLKNDNPDERGASEYRVKVERIDPAKGSAVAYVAKYVAKNIDGMHVGSDLYGQPALETSARVEAWASTWRIRQFQQIGGAPVGVWRELRRVHPGNVPMDAGQVLHDAVAMVNVSAIDAAMAPSDSEAIEAHKIRRGWASYVMSQGGPMAKRKHHKLRIHRDDTGEIGRYGDAKARAVVGVVGESVEHVAFGIVRNHARRRFDVIESERCSWITAAITQDSGSRARVVGRMAAVFADREAQAAHVQREAVRTDYQAKRREALAHAGHRARGEALRPWTRVNNCTQGEAVDDPFKPKVIHTPKVGQVFQWNRGRFKGKHHVEDSASPGKPGTRPHQGR
jgi:hypothetical protein